MLKKIASKIKSLFGSKSKKKLSAPEIQKSEKTSTLRHNKPLAHEKSSAVHKPRRPYKKETKEEYRLRHEKKALPQKKIEKPLQIEAAQEVWDESVFKVPEKSGKIRFHDLKLPNEILRAVYDLGFSYCTDVQAETLPQSLAGQDVTAQAQTGTGKTAAFLITIFKHVLANKIDKKRKNGTPRALILAPTRELVLQIEKDARALGKYVPCKILSLLGGIDYAKQIKSLKYEEADVLICTPGRLIDFMQKKLVDLSKTELLIIDEADRMLDMGFIPSVKKIIASTPAKAKRQTMFFSATLSGDVKRLA